MGKLKPKAFKSRAQGHTAKLGFEPSTVRFCTLCGEEHSSASLPGRDPVAQGVTGLSQEPGFSEGRVRISALGPLPNPRCTFPSAPHGRSRSAGRSRPLRSTTGRGQLTPIPLLVQPPRAPQAPATLTDPAAAHLPRTPDAGAAGSPSGGGLLPRSPSRDVTPGPEAASAMARAGQVRGSGRPGRQGTAGAWGGCSRGARRRRRQRPHPPARAAVPACPSAASRPRPRRSL